MSTKPEQARDWSLLEATQESLREHMAEVKRLQAIVDKYENGILNHFAEQPTGKTQEALKLALEALEAESMCANRYDDAIVAVREALAEQPAQQPAQQQEPVEEFAYKAITKRGEHCHFGTHAAARIWAGEGGEVETIKLRHLELVEQPAQQQEPVAWGMPSAGGGFVVDCITPEEHDRVEGGYTIPLYTSPQPAQQQEPVAWVLEWTFNGEERGRRLYDDETHCVFDAKNDGGVCRPLVYGDTSPPASKPLTEQMVVAAARMLSDRQAAACNVDCGDMWKLHGNDFLEDARAALEAAHGIIGEQK